MNRLNVAFRRKFRQRHGGKDPILDVSKAGADPADLDKPALNSFVSIWPVILVVGEEGGPMHRSWGSPFLGGPTLFDVLEEMALALAETTGDPGVFQRYEVRRHGGVKNKYSATL